MSDELSFGEKSAARLKRRIKRVSPSSDSTGPSGEATVSGAAKPFFAGEPDSETRMSGIWGKTKLVGWETKQNLYLYKLNGKPKIITRKS